MNSLSNWPRNRLLLALPSSDLQQLMPELEQIRCEREQILMDADSSLDHVFFPDSGVVSAVAVYADGSIIEMATNLLAEMLGVQRPTVTNAARELERAGLIARGRRQLTLLDRQGIWRNLANVISWFARASLLTFPKHTREKGTRAESVIYITDRSSQRDHNGGW